MVGLILESCSLAVDRASLERRGHEASIPLSSLYFP
jgi:hypothetical protein